MSEFMAKKAQNSEAKKSHAGILLVTVICLIVSMFLIREFVFAPIVHGPVEDPKTEVEAREPGEQKPVAEESKPVTPEARSAAPAPTEPKKGPEIAGEPVDFAGAKFHEVSVGSAADGTGFTVVFSERGAVMTVVRFIDGPRASGKPTFVRTPADPGIKPDRNDPEQTLLLLGPTRTMASWVWDASIGEYVPLEAESPHHTAFPDYVSPAENKALFDTLWKNDAEFPYGFSGVMAKANGVRWTTTGVEDHGGHKGITFTLPGGDAGVTFTKSFRVYPGFKVVCDVSATAGAGAQAQEVTFALNGPAGIREDLFKAERAGVVTLFEAGQGLVYEHNEHIFGDSLMGEFNDYRAELAESGAPPAGNVFPVHRLHSSEPGHRAMMHGLTTGYFMAVVGCDYVLPRDEIPGASVRFPYHPTDVDQDGNRLFYPALGSIVQTVYSLPPRQIEPGATVSGRVVMYTGPQDRQAVEAAFAAGNPLVKDGETTGKASWHDLIPHGWPAFISAPITWVLEWLQSLTGMAGIAIICLVLIVRLAISPLSVKAQVTMQVHGDKMRKIKPKLDAIKEKYRDQKGRDAQLLAFQETRAVMKANNVSMIPLGGCLILLLQMPIFIALYNTVRTSFMLRHEDFLWIRDLARPDNLFGAAWQYDIFLIGSNGFVTFNLLPILWATLLIVQQWLQPKPSDEQQARMQKQMAIIMPLMGLFFYAMPAGFTLYFVVSSVFSFAESRLVKYWLVKTGRIEAGGGVSALAPM